MRSARIAGPLVRRTEAFRLQSESRVDTAADVAAHLFLQTLTVNGTEFDPELAIEGYRDFVAACGSGRGVLLVAPHAANAIIQIRRFHDDGLRPLVVTGDAEFPVAGLPTSAATVFKTPTFLLEIRRRLREGRLVCAMIDRGGHHERGRTIEFETVNGPVILAPALLHIAASCGAAVAFTEVHVERGRLRGRIQLARGTSGQQLTDEFVSFVQAHVAARFGRGAA